MKFFKIQNSLFLQLALCGKRRHINTNGLQSSSSVGQDTWNVSQDTWNIDQNTCNVVIKPINQNYSEKTLEEMSDNSAEDATECKEDKVFLKVKKYKNSFTYTKTIRFIRAAVIQRYYRNEQDDKEVEAVVLEMVDLIAKNTSLEFLLFSLKLGKDKLQVLKEMCGRSVSGVVDSGKMNRKLGTIMGMDEENSTDSENGALIGNETYNRNYTRNYTRGRNYSGSRNYKKNRILMGSKNELPLITKIDAILYNWNTVDSNDFHENLSFFYVKSLILHPKNRMYSSMGAETQKMIAEIIRISKKEKTMPRITKTFVYSRVFEFIKMKNIRAINDLLSIIFDATESHEDLKDPVAQFIRNTLLSKKIITSEFLKLEFINDIFSTKILEADDVHKNCLNFLGAIENNIKEIRKLFLRVFEIVDKRMKGVLTSEKKNIDLVISEMHNLYNDCVVLKVKKGTKTKLTLWNFIKMVVGDKNIRHFDEKQYNNNENRRFFD